MVGGEKMNLGKSILQGITGAFLLDGIEVNKLDVDNQVLYLTIPERSYTYEESEKIKCASDYAKRIKETWIEMGIFSRDCTVKYKTKDIYWTKEMGEKNYEENMHRVLNIGGEI